MTTFLRVGAACLCLLLACGEPPDPLDEIRALHRRGRFASTVDRLRVLVDEDPSRTEAQFLLGVALLRTGEAGLAVWPLSKAAESPEYAVEAGLLLTQAMLQSRTAPDAVATIERVLALEPDNVNALVLRLQAYLATGRLEEALAESERVLELDPDNLAVLVPRVTTLIALERIEEAETALEIARERIETTEQEVDDTLRARLCVADGLFRFEKGEPEAAEARYAECLERFPEDPLVVNESVAFYGRIGQPKRATEILEQGLEQYGGSFFRLALARRMGALGNTAEAERLLREEAEERPSSATWFLVADFHVQREEFDAALEAFERALAASGDPPPMLRFAYADTLVQAKQLEKARSAARTLEQPALRDLIRGRILLEEGDAQRALQAFEAGIRLWPNNAGGRFLAGEAAERVGAFERASSHYRESLRANAGQTKAGLALARLYAAHGNPDDALDAVQPYVQSHRGDPAGYLEAIRIAHGAGRHRIAAQGLQRLAELPGQAARAKAEEAALLAADRGPELAVQAIDSSGLDLSDPGNAPALRVLLAQLAALGEHARAGALVRAAIEAHPEEAVFHELRGHALRTAGEPASAAREAYQRALELDPARAGALTGLAELAAAAGERDAALAFYDRAAEADPDEPAHPLAAAKLLLDAGQSDAAVPRLEQLLARHPREAGPALDLARILAERGELERALALTERAAWLRAPDAEAARARIRALGSGSADRAAPPHTSSNTGSVVAEPAASVE